MEQVFEWQYSYPYLVTTLTETSIFKNRILTLCYSFHIVLDRSV